MKRWLETTPVAAGRRVRGEVAPPAAPARCDAARVATLIVMAAVAGPAMATPPAPQPAQPQPVTVPGFDRSGRQPVALPGLWFAAGAAAVPQPASAPAPAVVLLHGCGGAFDRRGLLDARLAAMAARFNALGASALVVDSFSPRGEREICTQRVGARHVTQADRRSDALGALQWLAAQPGVDAARLGLVGWSNGGSTVLAATNRLHADVAAAAQAPSLAVAFYPGCAADLKRGWQSATPLLLLVGEADDWTPAPPCMALAAQAASAPPLAAPVIEVYASAWHGFDGSGPVRLRNDVPNGARPGAGVHVGGDAAARAASALRLDAFVRERWGLPPALLPPAVQAQQTRPPG